jgi:ABC-2 type transport system ATP-binding protein
MLEFRNLQKKFGDKPVIDIADFKLDPGIYWLQGPNGSGKTTLLRMIAGLIPFNGDILINGVNQKGSALAYRRLVSWADAEPVYPNFINGQDLVGFYMEIRNVAQQKIDPLIDIFGVRDYLPSALDTYSSGMTKKLSLLLAFIGEPKIILLDEPLTTLDKESVPKVDELITDYHRHKNTSFLISSHQEFSENVFHSARRILIANQTVQLLQ